MKETFHFSPHLGSLIREKKIDFDPFRFELVIDDAGTPGTLDASIESTTCFAVREHAEREPAGRTSANTPGI